MCLQGSILRLPVGHRLDPSLLKFSPPQRARGIAVRLADRRSSHSPDNPWLTAEKISGIALETRFIASNALLPTWHSWSWLEGHTWIIVHDFTRYFRALMIGAYYPLRSVIILSYDATALNKRTKQEQAQFTIPNLLPVSQMT